MIGVLVSGTGTNLQALLDAGLPIVAVASNRRDAPALRRVPGLEFLAEQVEDEVDPDEFAAVDSLGREHRYRRQVFLIASDRSASPLSMTTAAS